MFSSVKRRLSGTVLALTIALVGVAAVTPPASAARDLGGLNLSAWCKASTPSRSSYVTTVSPHNAYSWRCVWKGYAHNGYITSGMDLNRACRWTYGGKAYAKTNKPSSPTSWRCYR